MPRPSWYQVLGVPPTASADDIKQAFRQAALRLHPDKAGSSGGGAAKGDAAAAAAQAAEEFLLVQQAWEVLQDAEQRAAYDRQLALQAAAENVHINETVPLEDMDAEEVDGQACLAWPCRCGGSYLVLAEEAEAAAAGADGQAAELIVPCTTCSLNIRALAPPRPAQ